MTDAVFRLSPEEAPRLRAALLVLACAGAVALAGDRRAVPALAFARALDETCGFGLDLPPTPGDVGLLWEDVAEGAALLLADPPVVETQAATGPAGLAVRLAERWGGHAIARALPALLTLAAALPDARLEPPAAKLVAQAFDALGAHLAMPSDVLPALRRFASAADEARRAGRGLAADVRPTP